MAALVLFLACLPKNANTIESITFKAGPNVEIKGIFYQNSYICVRILF